MSSYRIWALGCPFRKDGWPVVGTFGARIGAVIILEADTWKQLCEAIPELAAMEFEVGTDVEESE